MKWRETQETLFFISNMWAQKMVEKVNYIKCYKMVLLIIVKVLKYLLDKNRRRF